MSSLTFVPPDGTGHITSPKSGTGVRESDGEPASLVNADDYSVTAGCARCRGRIRLGHPIQWEWRHAPAAAAAARGSAS